MRSLGLTDNIGETVDAPIARPVRDYERRVVPHGDEAGRITTWACVDPTVTISRRENEER